MSGKQPIKTVVAEWESELGVMLSRNRAVNTEWQSRPWLPGSDMVLVGLDHSPRGQRRRLTVSGHWSRILGYIQERNQPPLGSGFFRFHCFESIPDIFFGLFLHIQLSSSDTTSKLLFPHLTSVLFFSCSLSCTLLPSA